MFINYIIIFLFGYLAFTGLVAFAGRINYRDALGSPNQVMAILFIYWWVPIFRMIDMAEHNERIEEKRY